MCTFLSVSLELASRGIDLVSVATVTAFHYIIWVPTTDRGHRHCIGGWGAHTMSGQLRKRGEGLNTWEWVDNSSGSRNTTVIRTTMRWHFYSDNTFHVSQQKTARTRMGWNSSHRSTAKRQTEKAATCERTQLQHTGNKREYLQTLSSTYSKVITGLKK